ncbi:MAG: 2-octaprenyl-6-methoxy,4-benzoquinone methylase [Candidatus Krumholzibacteriota bacterium]|nr:2-octaprenyl-6-methoxy,4-benzoquinone methylase [Candidatus Krumholzibacteriota bacterium]
MTAAPDKSRTPEMFSRIAGRYDLLNHLLSLNIDRSWRRALVEQSGLAAGGRVLDVCAGTGDVAVAFAKHAEPSEIVCVDLSREMLEIGIEKARRRKLEGVVRFVEGDALRLPFGDGRFDAVSIAFGLRNLPDYAAGIAEMKRVLAPGGRLLVLEFAPPSRDLYRKGYAFYLGRLVPFVGGAVSGSREAYRYLASSVGEFVTRERVVDLFQEAGLKNVSAKPMTGGIVFLYIGEK